jgi:hypothetical protein
MDLLAFLDTLKKLSSVDYEPWMSEEFWSAFRDNPVRVLMRADDATKERIWRLVAP